MRAPHDLKGCPVDSDGFELRRDQPPPRVVPTQGCRDACRRKDPGIGIPLFATSLSIANFKSVNETWPEPEPERAHRFVSPRKSIRCKEESLSLRVSTHQTTG